MNLIATHFFVFNYISNGRLQKPNKCINWPKNKCINWPKGGLGVSRYFQAPVFPERTITDRRSDNRELNG